jgi:hypothetical protein
MKIIKYTKSFLFLIFLTISFTSMAGFFGDLFDSKEDKKTTEIAKKK